MKKFFVSKSDTNRLAFIKNAIQEICPTKVYILCEKDRAKVYEGIEALILPLKDLNKADNWIEFTKTINENCLLVIDNVLKCIYFGDGKKEYLKNISQSIKNIIVTDVVPFYTEPHEIFYPFYLLGKNILGYGSYNSFKGNHFEEKQDGSIDVAHSFAVLKDKIKNYYVQDYDNFFEKLTFVEFKMSTKELDDYEKLKANASTNFSNPIKLYNDCSVGINQIASRWLATAKCIEGLHNFVVVNNSASFSALHRRKLGNIPLLTFHHDIKLFDSFDNIVFMQLPIVKEFGIFYILATDNFFYQLRLTNNNLENHFFNRIYNNELRKQFDAYFYHANL